MTNLYACNKNHAYLVSETHSKRLHFSDQSIKCIRFTFMPLHVHAKEKQKYQIERIVWDALISHSFCLTGKSHFPRYWQWWSRTEIEIETRTTKSKNKIIWTAENASRGSKVACMCSVLSLSRASQRKTHNKCSFNCSYV